MMLRMPNAIHDRVSHQHVLLRHADLCPQHMSPVRKLAGPHAAEQVEVFIDRSTPVRAVGAGFRCGSTSRADFFQRQTADISFVVANELFGPLINLFEVVRGVEQPVFPVESQPAHVFHDGIHVLRVFFFRVGVVKPQIGFTAVFLGDAEVQADRLRVADVQIAIRFRRKSRKNSPAPFAGRQIVFHDLTNKIAMGGRSRISHFRRFRCVLRYSTLGRAAMENTCSCVLPEVMLSVLWQVKSRTT